MNICVQAAVPSLRGIDAPVGIAEWTATRAALPVAIASCEITDFYASPRAGRITVQVLHRCRATAGDKIRRHALAVVQGSECCYTSRHQQVIACRLHFSNYERAIGARLVTSSSNVSHNSFHNGVGHIGQQFQLVFEDCQHLSRQCILSLGVALIGALNPGVIWRWRRVWV